MHFRNIVKSVQGRERVRTCLSVTGNIFKTVDCVTIGNYLSFSYTFVKILYYTPSLQSMVVLSS